MTLSAAGTSAFGYDEEIESLKAELGEDGADLRSWHKKAKAQAINWSFLQNDKQVVIYVIHRKTRKMTVEIATLRARKGDKFYRFINKLPDGLQVVLPEGWTVNFDSKAVVAKIKDPENISESELDNNGGKTFTSGEAFIILKQGSMAVKPPEQQTSLFE